MKKEKILFICSGNTCRSVMAQALFQKLKDEIDSDLPFQAYSAGTRTLNGTSSPREAVFAMAKRGLDISKHQARQVAAKIMKDSLLVLTMTNQQKIFLNTHFPEASRKIFLFRPYCYQANLIGDEEIEDPYGKGLSFYESLSYQLEQDITRLIHYLRKEKSR